MSETSTEPGNTGPAPEVRGGAPFAGRINSVTTQDPWLWLAAGWRDMIARPGYSIGYGTLFVALGYAVTIGLYQLELTYMIWPMVAGFFLVAPLFCTGFYEISRRLETGEALGWGGVLFAWRGHARTVFGAGLALVFFMIIWIRVAALIYAINFPYTGLSIEEMTVKTFFTTEGLTFLAVGTVLGAGLAFVAFLLSAVSLQTMIGHDSDFVPAILISVLAVVRNFLPMMLWAAIIAGVTGLGMAAALIGLAVTLPLIGHASWHAFRALVREPD